MELIAEHVCKEIRHKKILVDVNVTLSSGKVYGFTGKNGSGKSMLFRALSGLMKIDSGTVRLGDKVLKKDFAVLPSLGIVLENAGLYPEFTGKENLRMLASVKKKITDREIEEAICRVGLDPADKRTYRKYSLGMKQRIVIAQAIMERPDIIMLDEPTNSLDEDSTERIRRIICEERERGAMILLASHSKEDIALLVDEVYQIQEGRVFRL